MLPTSPPPRPRGRSRRAGLGLAAALALGVTGCGQRPPAPSASLATTYPTPRALPAFSLTRHDGTRFDRAALEGHYTVLFLGFSQCLDVCPATLATLAAAMQRLPGAHRPQVVMVSVDPAHDTPEVLAAFVAHFDPAFVGAVGPEPAFAPLATALGAYYAPGSADGAQRVTHSGALFLIDPAAHLRAVYTTLPPPAALAADLESRLVGGGS
jgi:protein SCO1/2